MPDEVWDEFLPHSPRADARLDSNREAEAKSQQAQAPAPASNNNNNNAAAAAASAVPPLVKSISYVETKALEDEIKALEDKKKALEDKKKSTNEKTETAAQVDILCDGLYYR